MSTIDDIRGAIRDIPDFPKPGIVFKDITPLVGNGPLFRKTIDLLAERYEAASLDTVVGVESRGFIIGAALAYRLGKGLCVVRKPGKLPYDTLQATYELEYGTDTLEVHSDGLVAGARVLLVDDLVATGGTAAAAAVLVEQLGGTVLEHACIIELAFLKPREKLDQELFSLIQYDSE
ncbi:MAG: adenine phosphoribosyltransferase [Deltaproteobacteria bacterium]|jgi:adenine phosphoribosyltransferase|nr:adenine phosphoribosyltransferase [Deltaproteobacteria bacterium]